MPTKCSRIIRFPIEITPRAVEIWTQMWELERRCTCDGVPEERHRLGYRCPSCERWSKLDNELSLELHCKPWETPCTIHPDDNSGPDNRWSRIMKARWRALDSARREAHRLKRQSRNLERADLSSDDVP
jgi:hypothetical protein